MTHNLCPCTAVHNLEASLSPVGNALALCVCIDGWMGLSVYRRKDIQPSSLLLLEHINKRWRQLSGHACH